MISYNLTGKTALVTGGASGIGFATARMLAKFGATVAVNHLTDDPRGPEAVDRINAEASARACPGRQGDRRAGQRRRERQSPNAWCSRRSTNSGGSTCW